MTGSICYIASIDTSNANPDGTIVDDKTIILDAVPRTALLQYQRDENLLETRETIDFLLLRLNIKNQSNIGELEGRDLVCFNLSDIRPNVDNSIYPANSLDFSLNGEVDSEGQQFWIEFLTELPTETEISALKYLAEINNYPDATESDCQNIFSYVDDYNPSVGIYDVGQANLCAVVDDFEHPLVFFDLGWPVCFNHKSNPDMNSFNPFAFEDDRFKTPVVLSHFDWDHWAYAYKSGKAVWDKEKGYWKSKIVFRADAINRPWLVRRPNYENHKLGASHINFIQTLSKQALFDGSKALNIWPNNSDEISSESITVFKCKPESETPTTPAFLRNNESLAMLVMDMRGNAKVLLCGDADYPSIPEEYRELLSGIVAPHHGGKTTPRSTPNAVGHGRMVMSTYPGCYSNIPSLDVENEAKLNGWELFKTSDRVQCSNNAACITGNKLIRLSTSPRCGCGIVGSNCLCLQ